MRGSPVLVSIILSSIDSEVILRQRKFYAFSLIVVPKKLQARDSNLRGVVGK